MGIYQKTKEIASQTYQDMKANLQRNRHIVCMYVFCVVSLCLVAGLLLWLVKIRTEIYMLGYKISNLQRQQYELREEISVLAVEWEKCTKLGALWHTAQEKELKLVPPEIWKAQQERNKEKQ